MYRQMEIFLMALTCLTEEQKEKISELNEKEVFSEYLSVWEYEVAA